MVPAGWVEVRSQSSRDFLSDIGVPTTVYPIECQEHSLSAVGENIRFYTRLAVHAPEWAMRLHEEWANALLESAAKQHTVIDPMRKIVRHIIDTGDEEIIERTTAILRLSGLAAAEAYVEATCVIR